MAITKLGQEVAESVGAAPYAAGLVGGGLGGLVGGNVAAAQAVRDYDKYWRKANAHFWHANPNINLGLDKMEYARKLMRNKAIRGGALGGALGGAGAFLGTYGLSKLLGKSKGEGAEG